MSMVCPQCQQTFEPQDRTGACGCQSFFPSGAGPHGAGEGHWQNSPWGKILIGLLLAQGLSFGLQQLLHAGWLVSGEAGGAGVWGTLLGLVLLHAVHLTGLLVGGAITGAGQERGLLYGLFVGLFNGAVFLAFHRQHATEGWGDLVIFAQPVLHMGAGAAGGLIGMLIWRPIPSLPALTAGPALAETPPGPRAEPLLAGPVHGARVAVGATLVVAGVLWSHAILDLVLKASQGALTISSNMQAQLVGWEIAALATLFGAGLAGASTANGFKQGLCVGFGSLVLIVGAHLAAPRLSFDMLLLVAGSVLVLSVVGGWFGGQLFPPVVQKRKKLSAY